MHLITNAIKYARPGVAPEISTRMEKEGSRFTMTFKESYDDFS